MITVKKASGKDLSNNLKSIMLMLRFILGKMKKIPGGAIVGKCWKNKSSDYSNTFTASRVAWVAKEWDNTVELAFGVFFFLR